MGILAVEVLIISKSLSLSLKHSVPRILTWTRAHDHRDSMEILNATQFRTSGQLSVVHNRYGMSNMFESNNSKLSKLLHKINKYGYLEGLNVPPSIQFFISWNVNALPTTFK
jgi:hypothetical protein